MTTNYEELGRQIGELVDRKNAAYGGSFAHCGDFLRLLFPHGLTPDRYGDALALVRVFDKMMRIATDRDAFGESPWRDIAGYGLLGAMQHDNQKQERTQRECQGNANAQDAPTPQNATDAGADPNTKRPITTSVDANRETYLSPTPSASSPAMVPARTPGATEAASPQKVKRAEAHPYTRPSLEGWANL